MALNGSLTVYGENLWISPYVFSSYVALKEKSLAFDLVEMALVDGAHFKPDYAATSITARIPSLEHEGFCLAESSAIAEYLEETFPVPKYPRLLPENLHDRARARQLMAWLRSDLDALREERSTVTMFYRLRLPELSAKGRRAADKLLRVAEQVIPADSTDLFGVWSLVDSEFAFMLHRLILNGHTVPPQVLAYAQAQWQRPAVVDFVQHSRPSTVPESYWPYSGTPRPEPA